MEYCKLGITEFIISKIGFGCAPMGGYDYGEVSDRDSIEAVRKAIDLGIVFFDTADVYGFGRAEKVLGKALGKERNKVIISTKFGLKWDDKGNVLRDCSKNRVIDAVDASLKRLQVDTIILYQMHWPDAQTPLEETLEALEVCRKNGKIKHLGFSNIDDDSIVEYFNKARFESLQSPYNLLQRKVEKNILQKCRDSNISFFAHSPLARGLLTGKYNINFHFKGKDTRNKSMYFSEIDRQRKENILKALNKISNEHNKTISQISIRWILENQSVASAIVGIKSADQINDVVGAIGWKLLDSEMLALNELTQKYCNSMLY